MIRPLIFISLSGFLLSSCNQMTPERTEQDSLVRAGDRVNAAGDPSSAISVYKSALEKNPPHKLPLYLKLGEAYMNAERLDEAKRVFEEALPLDEHDEVKKQLGRLYLSTGQPDSAIAMFEGIILVHKDDIKAFNGLGIAHDLKGDHQLAQDYYRKGLAINEECTDIKSNLGLSLAFSGRYEESLKLLQPIGEAISASSKQRHNLALAYALSGNHSRAQEIYAKDLNPGEVDENLHALRMAPKPIISPLAPKVEVTSKPEPSISEEINVKEEPNKTEREEEE